jgi:hypothetical protein
MQIGYGMVLRLFLLVASLALSAAPSQAVQFTLDVSVGGVSAGSLNATQLGCVDGPGFTASCTAQNITLGELLITNLDLSLDSDPVVSGEVAVQNIGLGTNQFTLIFTLLTGPQGPSTLTGGSVAGGVTDNNGNGATLSTLPGSAFYTALIDGVTHQMLFAHSVSLSAPAFESADLVPEGAFGTPIPSLPGPAVLNSIGIQYDFNLTSQDSASFTGVFVTQPVPEPSTALLVGLGLVIVARGGRRR